MELLSAKGRGSVILNPSDMQDSFKIFDRSFERLKNVWKILPLVQLTHSEFSVNYFHIDMELGLLRDVSSLNVKSEND